MCSGNAVPPHNWNRELHDIAGCDHDSPTARRLDSFLNDFMMAHHYNRPAEPVETPPLKPFTVTRRMREDAAKEPLPAIVNWALSPGWRDKPDPPQGCHKPDFIGQQQVPVVDQKAVERVMDFARDQKCAEVVQCKFKFFTRPGYCTGFWVTQHGRQIRHYDTKAEAEAQRDFLNAKSVFADASPDLGSCLMRPEKFTETDGTDGKTAADCFAKGGIVDLPRTTIGGFPVAPPIDLPPVEAKPRVRGLASLRRSWRVR